MISLDVESTGLDLRHGAKPFFVTICYEDGAQRHWEWDVDPLTRDPVIPQEDKDEIKEIVEGADSIVLQNGKFDATALLTIIPDLEWDWSKRHDTLLAGHLLASNQRHDLTSMALTYLGIDIKPLEEALKKACQKCRLLAKKRYPKWRIAKEGLPDMPSAKQESSAKGADGLSKSSPWAADMWLPRAIAKQEEFRRENAYWTLLRDYSNADSAVTMQLWQWMEKSLRSRNLWAIYEMRIKLLPIIHQMETQGVTISGHRFKELEVKFQQESTRLHETCMSIAKAHDYPLVIAKGSSVNNNMRTFMFDVLEIPRVKGAKSKSAMPSLDKNTMDGYISQMVGMPEHKERLDFIQALMDKRSRDTALSYMKGYRKFRRPIIVDGVKVEDWYRLHPSLNATGTNTLRCSSSNPNEQNISKQKGFSLRYGFGPAPGREWWSLDAQNIELRLPAYKAGQEEMIALFERPNDPPYFGSNHSLVCHILHPKLFDACLACCKCHLEIRCKESSSKRRDDEFCQCGTKNHYASGNVFKERYKSTWYSWTKNGNFAVQYGAVEASGTADRAYHMPGAQAIIQRRLGKISDLNRQQIRFAEKYGYIETMPDRTVDPDRGYPLLCTRTDWGRILPTVPLSYYIQGTACWWMSKAMIRCYDYLSRLNQAAGRVDYFITMQVHDELDFDFPAGRGKEPWKTNLPKIMKIKRLMEEGGNDIGIPTPVSVAYHANNWSEERGIN